MDKPNFRENKTKYALLKQIFKRLNVLSKAHQEYEDRVQRDIERRISELVDAKLKTIPVEELSKAKLGIRVATLRGLGFSNIYQLKNCSYSQLIRYPGIGDATASGVCKLVGDIIDETTYNTRVTIDNETRGKFSDSLVHDLFLLRKMRELSMNAEELLPTVENTLKKYKTETGPARSWFAWIFSSDSKKQVALEKFDEISSLSEDLCISKAEALFKEEQDALKAEHDAYWADYVVNVAAYNVSMENVRDGKDALGEGKTSTEKIAEKNGLPEELAIAISHVELNLKGLKCELRKYQRYGVQYILNQGAVLLGDDMGLGKTVEAIATMVALRNSGATHFIVVCPASVLINWMREIEKFSDLSVKVVHGNSCAYAMDVWQSRGGVAVTTYETLSKITVPADRKYDLLVVDEAHYVKNPNAARTRNLLFFRQHTDRALFMTGTPLENKVDEMVFLISCLQPKVAQCVKHCNELSSAPEFRRLVSGVYFRRTKEDVLEELPEKTEIEEWCELEPAERSAYATCVYDSNFMGMRQASWMIDDPSKSSKGKRLKELVCEYLDAGRKVLVFSFFINTIEQARKVLGDGCFGPISGSITPTKRQQIIDDFSKKEGGAVLLSQIQAGGTGLNVQAASVVIICEPQLKPSIENQAIARSYRMGQANKVMVHRLLCEKTVDEQIMNILKNKQVLFDNFADVSESGKESLINADTIKQMIQTEKERYRET